MDPAQLIVAALANNAATHGHVPGRNIRLLLYVVGQTLRIEVTDTRGDRLSRRHLTAPSDESGRGLTLVAALADRWGVIPGLAPRKTVWAELTLTAPLPPAPDGPRPGRTCAPYEPHTEEKEPRQAPPLPPAGQAHSRE